MKPDKLVLQRFSELEKKAEIVDSTRHGEYNEYVGHEEFYEWGTSVLNLLQRTFNEQSVHYQNFIEQYKKFGYRFSNFEKCRGIFRAAKEDYIGGYLFNMRALIKAEVLEDSIEQANELLKAGYKDPACVLVGVALETTLKEICTREGMAHGKLDRMNVEICKSGIYNMAKQKQITAWADLRNKAAHGDWDSYNKDDVNDFLQGVQRFMGDYL